MIILTCKDIEFVAKWHYLCGDFHEMTYEMKKKTIALVAHDNRKPDLIEWAEYNRNTLSHHTLVGTGTTGALIESALNQNRKQSEKPIKVRKLKSGPLGGDQQLGALIAEGAVDMLIFLWDPMQPQPHDVDVKALLRISNLYNVPTACNRTTADYLISSPLLSSATYRPMVNSFSEYVNRRIDV